MMTPVTVRDITIGSGGLVLIAGPCVIESREHARFMAESIAEIASRTEVPLIFKASFDKANRSSISSYRGPGLEKGLEILSGIRKDLGVPVITDIHEPSQARAAASAVDIIQIPAFLCRQTDILLAAGETGLPVNIKKGQYMAAWDMAHAVKKVESTGNRRVMITERGTSFGYNNLVCDLRNLGLMRSLGVPVVLDVTHSLQLPGGRGDSSGGMREFVPSLARAGVAFGVDALFMEVHDDPDNALSDGPNSLPLNELEPLLKQVCEIQRIVV
ncbi:MAG TPA: 3-deoxy-8-phosphooctulonate synthase [Deltaproteobacteria bacterium]|jgi:2-dehydro-3-deoxyphosphooctonate aldolase (KDO 8-P synthase)|nr:3-deoxy-8-phosphooctulonate synthase [Deltaproteobacteria bacterium]HRR20407.1 3-deoxy-8-phosphooctulonate synthase [Desulfomonilia bacterium]HRT44529.1 3-deoxy-8-phosphooctulonate synthase [Desulfomonilia bacterium]